MGSGCQFQRGRTSRTTLPRWSRCVVILRQRHADGSFPIGCHPRLNVARVCFPSSSEPAKPIAMGSADANLRQTNRMLPCYSESNGFVVFPSDQDYHSVLHFFAPTFGAGAGRL